MCEQHHKTTNDYLPLIQEVAASHGLPEILVFGIAEHESAGGNTFAFRFEPAFYTRYILPLPFTGLYRPAAYCSEATERHMRATSWGLMQLMGQTARELGFIGWFSELCMPEVGLDWGCIYLRQLFDRYGTEGWSVVLRAYNGGPGNRHNEANTYPAKILTAMGMESWDEFAKRANA